MNEKLPLVSIIMNCYNGEAYLKESINSTLLQTYKNWELIFWDNRSDDKSAEIFKSYKDKRFQYYYSDKHTSLYEARNLAIEKSKGDFIAFIDTDDLWDKKKIEEQMKYFNNDEVGVVYSKYWLIKKNLKKKKINSKKELPSGKIFEKLIKNYNIGILTTIIRKKYYLKLSKKFDERFSIIGDFDLFLRLSKICIFKCSQIPFAFYRLHGKNFSSLNKNKEVEELNVWLKENKDNLDTSSIKKIQENILYRKFVNSKMDRNYKDCINILFNSQFNLINLKNLIIFLMPVSMLKKLLWYHQD